MEIAADRAKVLCDEGNVLDDAYGTEIFSINSMVDDDYVKVDFVQGDLAGSQLIRRELLDELEFSGGPRIPVDDGNAKIMIPVSELNTVSHSDTEKALELYNRKKMMVPDLSELPNANDLGSVLSDLYNEAQANGPAMVFLDEDNIEDILKMGQGKSVQAVCESVEADLKRFPTLMEVIEVNPKGPEEGEPIVTCYMDFPCRITRDFDRENRRSADPVMLNQASEEVLGCVKEAVSKELEVIEACKEHNIKDRQPRKLEEALYAFGHTSGKVVLQVLKKEASRTKKEKDCTVLDGALKYESQYDRKEALKQVKGWMKKPCDKVAGEIEKLQEKNRAQGR